MQLYIVALVLVICTHPGLGASLNNEETTKTVSLTIDPDALPVPDGSIERNVKPLGKIKGLLQDFGGNKVEVYWGIPYAKPPTDDRRFQKPEEFGAWKKQKNPLDATERPKSCWQDAEYPYPWMHDEDDMSEDCLYLNIWKPNNTDPTEKLPVMFFIHGGFFYLGSSTKDIYDGRALATLGNVVVVTLNYRLGALGFLYSDDDDDNAPGNVGLYDIQLALTWVNNYIEYFDGDSSLITIFGFDAGSVASGLFLVSPLTDGLFKRAIMQSESPVHLPFKKKDENLELSKKLANDLDCDSSASADISIGVSGAHASVGVGKRKRRSPLKASVGADVSAGVSASAGGDSWVDCLRKKDPADIVKQQIQYTKADLQNFSPHYSDDIVPDKPRDLFIDLKYHDHVDLFIGVTNDEGSNTVTSYHKGLDDYEFHGTKGKPDHTDAEDVIKRHYKVKFDESNLDDVNKHYLGGISSDYQLGNLAHTAVGDYLMVCPNEYTAEWFAVNPNNSVFFYVFSHHTPNHAFHLKVSSQPEYEYWMGTPHADEVQYVFGMPLRYPRNYTNLEVSFTTEVMQIWSTFAHFGTPRPGWPRYTRKNPSFEYIQPQGFGLMGYGPHHDHCEFLRPFLGFDVPEPTEAPPTADEVFGGFGDFLQGGNGPASQLQDYNAEDTTSGFGADLEFRTGDEYDSLFSVSSGTQTDEQDISAISPELEASARANTDDENPFDYGLLSQSDSNIKSEISEDDDFSLTPELEADTSGEYIFGSDSEAGDAEITAQANDENSFDFLSDSKSSSTSEIDEKDAFSFSSDSESSTTTQTDEEDPFDFLPDLESSTSAQTDVKDNFDSLSGYSESITTEQTDVEDTFGSLSDSESITIEEQADVEDTLESLSDSESITIEEQADVEDTLESLSSYSESVTTEEKADVEDTFGSLSDSEPITTEEQADVEDSLSDYSESITIEQTDTEDTYDFLSDSESSSDGQIDDTFDSLSESETSISAQTDVEDTFVSLSESESTSVAQADEDAFDFFYDSEDSTTAQKDEGDAFHILPNPEVGPITRTNGEAIFDFPHDTGAGKQQATEMNSFFIKPQWRTDFHVNEDAFNAPRQFGAGIRI